ncbi:outer membrane protein assembly factor BamA [Alphaproteobacteria bacterium]|nr:outer membrane protein assembly factor BamA [Alphaproteobacteria bacterium]
MKLKLLFLSILIASASFEARSELISKIEFVGCQRVDPETISSYLLLKEGCEYDQDLVNEALKTLNSTGFFEEVKIDKNGSVLCVRIKEYPIINRISFEGNSKISDKDIKNAVKLNPREILSPPKIKEIQQGLLDAYRRMGMYNVRIDPKIIRLANNKVNLVFEIKENAQAKIKKIIFVGNSRFSSNELRDVIFTKEDKWFRFFVTDDKYDAERVQEDKSALIRFYHEHGYANAKICEPVAELSSDKKYFTLTFTIDEGKIYRVRDVKITSHIKQLPEKDLWSGLYTKKGNIYNSTYAEIDCGLITKTASLKGIPSVNVEPDIKKIEDNDKQVPKKVKKNNEGLVDIVFNVYEGSKIYISKIIIKGNTRTREHIIRREIPIQEGDSYNKALVNMAENNIRGLGFFRNVSVDMEQDPNSPDKAILNINVEETSTGEAMISGSFSTGEGVGVDLTYNERNFLGTGKGLTVFLGSGRVRSGKSFKINNETGAEEKVRRKEKFRFLNSVHVTLSDPHFLDKDIEGTVSVFRFQGARDAFSIKEIGGALGASYELSSLFSQGWEYGASNRKFDDVSDQASPAIKQQVMRKEGNKFSKTRAGKHDISSIKHNFNFHKYFIQNDSNFSASLVTTFAGLGGNARHIGNEIFLNYVIKVQRRSSLKFSFSTGLLSKIGNKKPHIIDCYSKGMDSFRGFDDCGVGPFYETTSMVLEKDVLGKPSPTSYKLLDYAGATRYWKGTVQLNFPLGAPPELQLEGFIFSDFGWLGQPPENGKKYFKTYKLNSPEAVAGRKARLITTDSLKKAFHVDSMKEIENEELNFSTIDSQVFRHRIIDRRSIRMSLGGGVQFLTPFGPIVLTYAVPIKKTKTDVSFRFLISFATRM